MKKEFDLLFSEIGIKESERNIIFENLVKCYSESHRDYHTLRHIREMLNALSQFRATIIDYPSLYFATLYHDIIYETKALDNEEKSAEYLEKELKNHLDSDKIKKCKDLILGTKSHQFLEDDFDNKIFLDSDLLILGSDRMRYVEYMNSIRTEYSWVEIETYKLERSKILKKFLERKQIYFTNEFYTKYEKQARENLLFEIEMYFQK